MVLGTRGEKVYKNYFSDNEIGFDDLGRWMFLATVFDPEKGEVSKELQVLGKITEVLGPGNMSCGGGRELP